MAKELIEYDVFDAGMNTKADPINLLPGQSDNMNNILFGDYGSIKSRGGVSTYNSTPMTANQGILGMASYQPSTMSAQLIVACKGHAFIMTGASTVPVLLHSDPFPIINSTVEMSQMNDLLFMVSPDSNAYKFNGREFTRMGMELPSAKLTAASVAAGGNLNGQYRWVYWGVNSYLAESDYTVQPSDNTLITSGMARVGSIPTAPISHGINIWKIGRSTAAASGVYWYVTDVTNGTTSFTDNVADASLDVLAPTDQGIVRSFYCSCVYGGRFWGVRDDYLWYSNVDQPEEFPSTNFIRVGRGSGLNISAITPFMGMIVISLSSYSLRSGSLDTAYTQRTALYVLRIGDSITFNDPENWVLNLIAENEGSESQRACIPVAGYLWMTGRKGVSLFDGNAVANSVSETATGAIAASKISAPVEDLFAIEDPSSIRMAAAIQWKDKVYLSLERTGITSVSPLNDTTLVYDYMRVGSADARKGAWSKFDSVAANIFVVHEDKLLGAGGFPNATFTNGGGYIYQFDNGTQTDTVAGNGTTIAPTYRMTAIRGKKNHVYHDKEFRIVNLWASGVGTLTATFKVNGLDYDGATLVHAEAITLTTAGTKTQIRLPAVAQGKHMWIEFTVAALANNVDLTLTRLQVFYNLKGLRNS